MKYSIINSERRLPFKDGKGICPCCGGETIAKCGRYKIHHWAHKSRKHCDPWWENEGEWHRKWKSYFPDITQEVVFRRTESGEKHIADVYINQTAIEFQSYSIKEDEARIREAFYNNLIWVIDGCKNEFDKIYFNMSVYTHHTNDAYLRKLRWCGRGKIFAKWSQSTKPVFLDFGTDLVWHLLSYNSKTKEGLIRAISKEIFVNGLGGKYT
ncbi:competence protein CoiA [Cellvibrio sp. UBA7661]|uniref:competence protein CoiA n=1 Tax=Cellvibrio sp. UBA7661 TaxID=1946311 RepID=UPI002F354B90